MIIIDPEKEILGMLWDDLKEFPLKWAKLLLWTVPTDILYEVFIAIYKRVWMALNQAPWWLVILLGALTGYIGGNLLLW